MDMSNKTSDENVANDIKILKKFCEYEEAVVLTDNALEEVQDAMQNILAEREQKDKRIQDLERKNKHLSNTSDYETISLECTHLEEQLDIANSRIQELEEENKRKDMFVEMAKEVIENSILKRVVIEVLEDIEDYFDRLNGPDEDIEYIRQVKKELLEGEK